MKKNLSDADAYVYVIEINVIQRSFSELAPSEKVAVLAERYDKVLYQRNRENIISELKSLEDNTKGGHDVHLSKNRDGLGEEYGLSGRSVAMLLRVNELIPELKDKLDSGDISLVAAVQLSYMSESDQKRITDMDKSISVEMASRVRSDGISALDNIMVDNVLDNTRKATTKSVKLLAEVYEYYFKGMKAADATNIIEQALNAWFKRQVKEVV